MNERMRFVTDRERELYSMVELCERYGVSRKTGYKWVARCGGGSWGSWGGQRPSLGGLRHGDGGTGGAPAAGGG